MSGVRATATRGTRKFCGKCKTWKDATTAHFYTSQRNPDGTPRTLKSWCIPCSNQLSRESSQRRRAMTDAAPVDQEGNRRLPIGPFREWLLHRLEQLEGSEDLLACEIGVDHRACYRWLHESRVIGIDQVDSALQHSGVVMLRDLYPELYDGLPDEEEALAA